MNICIAQTHMTTDLDANHQAVSSLIRQAAEAGADVVLFPEMSVTEFFPRHPHRYEFFDLAEPMPGPTTDRFAALAKKHHIAVVYNHYERSDEHLFFDACAVIDADGRFVGRQRMMHIAEEPGYNEKFYYTPGWDRYHVFELGGWKFGIAICYDRHFPEVFRSFVLQGAEFVLIPTAVAGSDIYAGTYELEMRAAAVTHGVYIAMANRAGREDPMTFMGQSMIINPQGEVVAALDEKPDQILTHELSKTVVTKTRTLFPFLRDRRPETYELLTEHRRADG